MKLPIFNTTRPLAPSINRLQNEGTAVEVVSRDLNSAPFNPSDAGDDALDGLRPLILDRLLWAAVLLGVLASALIMPRLLENGLLTTSLLTSPYGMWLALYGIIWIALVFAAFRRQMGVAWRAALLLLALFSTGLALLLVDGLAGSGQVVLLVIPFIAAIISGARGRMIGLALSLGALILMVVLIATGIVPPTGLLTARDSLLYWILAILIFSLLAISGVIALGLLVNGTQASLSADQGVVINVCKHTTAGASRRRIPRALMLVAARREPRAAARHPAARSAWNPRPRAQSPKPDTISPMPRRLTSYAACAG